MIARLTSLLFVFSALETIAFLAPKTTLSTTIDKHRTFLPTAKNGCLNLHTLYASDRHKNFAKMLPKAIIFDLDGCVWAPEMYQLMYGSPFKKDPENIPDMLTCNNQPVRLLGDIRNIFEELYTQECFDGVKIGISSRTDEPDWARELLSKFEVTVNEKSQPIHLINIFNGPVEIAKDSKKAHFRRIHAKTGINYEDMLFFDNEFGNCDQIAFMGVSVVYCPDGVTRKLWDMGLHDEFPRSDGSVINGDQGLFRW